MSQIELPEDWRQRIEELAGNGEERNEILGERAETEERLRRLTRLYQDLSIDEHEYRQTRERLQAQLASLVLPENPKVIEAGGYLEELGNSWAAASLEERRDLTRIMVSSVFVDVAEEEICGIEPVSVFRLLLEQICNDFQLALLGSS